MQAMAREHGGKVAFAMMFSENEYMRFIHLKCGRKNE